ncbi:MAG: alpha/beta hydrolase [Leptolyngbyaceae cyanobacterium]
MYFPAAATKMIGTIADPSPFLLTGGPVAVLLIHGFTGSPSEMRLLGHYLHERGLTVAAPLLPGHGTREEDLNQKRWTDWVDSVTQAYAVLRISKSFSCTTLTIPWPSIGSGESLQKQYTILFVHTCQTDCQP